ncbi:PadR family transcriptional regulator [Candidatus Aerophobetes bacterium]|nr:PadR family transcriptional regulator [Candidatus Aerophobetes bacterium]
MKLEERKYWASLINMSLCKFFILHTLYQAPIHGYVLLQRLMKFTQGYCVPTYSTIYPILKEFVRGKYAKVKLGTVKGRERKIYELTAKGEKAYGEALKAWQEIIPCIEKAINEGIKNKPTKRKLRKVK